jgi:hypothetical protein
MAADYPDKVNEDNGSAIRNAVFLSMPGYFKVGTLVHQAAVISRTLSSAGNLVIQLK